MYSLLDVKVKIKRPGEISKSSDRIFLLDANGLYLKTADGFYLAASIDKGGNSWQGTKNTSYRRLLVK